MRARAAVHVRHVHMYVQYTARCIIVKVAAMRAIDRS